MSAALGELRLLFDLFDDCFGFAFDFVFVLLVLFLFELFDLLEDQILHTWSQ